MFQLFQDDAGQTSHAPGREVSPGLTGKATKNRRHLDSFITCCYDSIIMRTTVTIDPDVQQLLQDAMQRSRQSFKETLNQAIRRGLADMVPQGDEPPFQVDARPLGLRAGIDPARLNQLNDDLEADAFLALTPQLRQGAGSDA